MDCLAKIQSLINERGWTMYQLSHRAGIPQSTLSNLFIRYNVPTVPTLEKICNALGITLSEFFADENTLNKDEARLLAAWHRMEPETQEALMRIVEAIDKNPPSHRQPTE